MGLFGRFGRSKPQKPANRSQPTGKAPTRLPVDIADLVAHSVRSLSSQRLPHDQLFMAATLRGLITGFVSGMNHPSHREALATHAGEYEGNFRQYSDELLVAPMQIFMSLLAPEVSNRLAASDDPTIAVLEEVCRHPGQARVKALFATNPKAATEIAVIVGMKIALMIWHVMPSLAEAVCKSQQRDDRATERSKVSSNDGPFFPHEGTQRRFDREGLRVLQIFYREDRSPEDRLKDTMAGGLIHGLSTARSNGPRRDFLSPDASDDYAYSGNLEATRSLIKNWASPTFQSKVFNDQPGNDPVSRTINMLWNLFVMGKGAEAIETGSRHLAYEAGCRSLAFAILLWEDQPELAAKLAMTIPVLRKELTREGE